MKSKAKLVLFYLIKPIVILAFLSLTFYFLREKEMRQKLIIDFSSSQDELMSTPYLSNNYIYNNYVKQGDLLFESGDYSGAESYYLKAIHNLKDLQAFYGEKSDSELRNKSQDRLINSLLVVENRLLLTTAAINSQETSLK